MAKKIIILNRKESQRLSYDYLLWADVPVARQSYYADPEKESRYSGATAQELLDLQDGKIAETGGSFQMETTSTLNDAKVVLEARFQEFQTEITNETTYDRFGTYWDGTTWTAGGA